MEREASRALKGKVDVRSRLTRWEPATQELPVARVSLELEMLGVPIEVTVTLRRINLGNFPEVVAQNPLPSLSDEKERASARGLPSEGTNERWEWEHLELARELIDIVTVRRDIMAKLAIHWAVTDLVGDELGLAQAITQAVLKGFDLPEHDYSIVEPLASDLPTSLSDRWRSLREDGVWHENVGDYLYQCQQVEYARMLADFLANKEAVGRWHDRLRNDESGLAPSFPWN